MTVEIDRTGSSIVVRDASGRALPMDPPSCLVRITTPGGAEATFYPAVGFNLIDWRIPVGDGQVAVVHAEPDALAGGSGTRSGMPILFPFPNRIAGATYTFDGREYRLTPAHEGDPNASHGFCAKTTWQDFEATGDNAVTARFLISRDAPQRLEEWPGDLQLSITFTLSDLALRVTARVDNPGKGPVPFGLGYHPYFTPLGEGPVDGMEVECRADHYWVLADSIPTGERRPVRGDNDLRSGPVLGSRQLDDVLTGLLPFVPEADGLMERAALLGSAARLGLRCDASFRDIVVFTPQNRQAVAVEPYTCPTDAVHLDAAGRDVGWRVLGPGESWTGEVEMRLRPR